MITRTAARRIIRSVVLGATALAAAWLCGCQVPKQVEKPVGPKYVRIEKADGRYWFVRGDERFLSLGVNVVEPMQTEPQGFSLPKDGRFYNALAKFKGDKAAWARDAAERLRSWNFNTAAGWSDDALFTNSTLYFTRVVNLGEWGHRDSRLIDVFSDKYAAEVDQRAAREVSPFATNEYLIGFFINNELPWYGEHGWASSPTISLLSRYMHLPEKAPGKIRLAEFLQGVYANDFNAFLANWDVKASSFDELLKMRQILPRTRTAKKDVIAWAGIVAEQYFKLCSAAVRQYDPNHLILGSRFSERAQEPVMVACGKYCDAISVNHYRKTGFFDDRQVGAIAALTGKPILITEFSWRAMENSSGCSNSKGADVTVKTQRDRVDCFRRYAANALAQPYLIGYDWFCYHDQPPAGRFDGENSNYGLVDIHDNFYTELVGAITEVNGRASDLHLHSQTPFPAYDPAVLADYREVTVAGADKPRAEPVVFLDGSSEFEGWGDFAHGSSIQIAPTGGQFVISVKPAGGWGCGVTFKPASSLALNEDNSVNVAGASRIVVVATAPAGAKFSAGINESGVGPTENQQFDGFGEADGEAYNHADIPAVAGRHEYVFELRQMDPNTGYGNQRGNLAIDTEAISTIHIFFPGSQSPFEMTLESIRLE